MRLLGTLLRSSTLTALLLVSGTALVLNGSPVSSTVYKWSTTASTNSSADATINWAEGMAPSAVNDSARAMMAAIAKWNADMAGATPTTGSSNTYVINPSNQVFASLSAMSGQRICFKPNFTNTGPATINVDTLGAKALRASASVELNPGALVGGTPYCAVYDNSASEWIITFVNANTTIPLGAIIDYGGSSAPSSNFIIPRGQAISRTTYAGLFALFSTTFGNGDGSTTFNVPDLGGRVVAGTEASASRLTSGGAGCAGNMLGATCGAENVTLAHANLPNVSLSSSGLSVNTAITNGINVALFGVSTTIREGTGSTFSVLVNPVSQNITLDSNAVSGNIPLGGSGTPMSRTQPTIVLNKLLRVL